MYHRTGNTRHNWHAITDPTPAAVAGSMVVVLPGAVLGTYLAGNVALGSSLLLGIGLVYRLFRLNGREGDFPERTGPERSGEIPIWFEWIGDRQPTTAEITAN